LCVGRAPSAGPGLKAAPTAQKGGSAQATRLPAAKTAARAPTRQSRPQLFACSVKRGATSRLRDRRIARPATRERWGEKTSTPLDQKNCNASCIVMEKIPRPYSFLRKPYRSPTPTPSNHYPPTHPPSTPMRLGLPTASPATPANTPQCRSRVPAQTVREGSFSRPRVRGTAPGAPSDSSTGSKAPPTAPSAPPAVSQPTCRAPTAPCGAFNLILIFKEVQQRFSFEKRLFGH
jgi:hypothetical protein